MDRLLFPIISLGLLFSASTFSAERCAKEKDDADYWNDLMREHVTERRRTKHREAKARFLDCLGEDNSGQRSTSQTRESRNSQKIQTGARKLTRQTIRRSAPKRGYTQNVYVSSYHNFKGAKKAAWSRYFRESPACMKNDGDMGTFVKCANERKHYLEQFNQNWNEKTQSLDSPISKQ